MTGEYGEYTNLIIFIFVLILYIFFVVMSYLKFIKLPEEVKTTSGIIVGFIGLMVSIISSYKTGKEYSSYIREFRGYITSLDELLIKAGEIIGEAEESVKIGVEYFGVGSVTAPSGHSECIGSLYKKAQYLKNKCNKCLFSWDEIKNNDMKRLKNFLKEDFGIEGVYDEGIKGDDKIIDVEFAGEYLFSLDKIRENDNDTAKFIEFLKQNFDIDWIKAEHIQEINDKTIKVSNGDKILSIRLNNEKTKPTMSIDNCRTDDFIVKRKNELEIYKKKYLSLILNDEKTKATLSIDNELFGWDKIQGKDSEIPRNDNYKFIKFLEQKYDIYGVTNIQKSDDKITVNYIKNSEEKSLSLSLINNKTKAKLTIVNDKGDGKTYEFNARKENDKLKIYNIEKKDEFIVKIDSDRNKTNIYKLAITVVALEKEKALEKTKREFPEKAKDDPNFIDRVHNNDMMICNTMKNMGIKVKSHDSIPFHLFIIDDKKALFHMEAPVKEDGKYKNVGYVTEDPKMLDVLKELFKRINEDSKLYEIEESKP